MSTVVSGALDRFSAYMLLFLRKTVIMARGYHTIASPWRSKEYDIYLPLDRRSERCLPEPQRLCWRTAASIMATISSISAERARCSHWQVDHPHDLSMVPRSVPYHCLSRSWFASARTAWTCSAYRNVPQLDTPRSRRQQSQVEFDLDRGNVVSQRCTCL